MLGAKTNDQYRAFQNEIEFAEASIRKCGPDPRTHGRLGVAGSERQKAEAALAQERKVVEAQKAKAKTRTDADQQELKKLGAERAEVAKTLPADVLTIYDRLRTRYYKNGDVIAQAKDGLCQMCMMALRPQFYQEVKLSTTINFCENCRRILYYEAPAEDVEAQMNG